MNDENQTPAQTRPRAPRVRGAGERPTGDKVERDPKRAALYQTLARALFASEVDRSGGDTDPQEMRGQRKEEWEAVKTEKVRQARRVVRSLEKRGKVKIEFVGELRRNRSGEVEVEDDGDS